MSGAGFSATVPAPYGRKQLLVLVLVLRTLRCDGT